MYISIYVLKSLNKICLNQNGFVEATGFVDTLQGIWFELTPSQIDQLTPTIRLCKSSLMTYMQLILETANMRFQEINNISVLFKMFTRNAKNERLQHAQENY